MRSSKQRLATVAPIRAVAGAAQLVKVGWVTEVRQGEARVDFPGNRGGPLPARSTVAIPPPPAVGRVEVVLLFEDGDLRRPLVVGVLGPATAEARLGAPGVIAEVDGRRLVLEGKDEVVLRCGEASITLRRNGRVVIRGAEVESRASGTNKVRGGSVRIN